MKYNTPEELLIKLLELILIYLLPFYIVSFALNFLNPVDFMQKLISLVFGAMVYIILVKKFREIVEKFEL